MAVRMAAAKFSDHNENLRVRALHALHRRSLYAQSTQCAAADVIRTFPRHRTFVRSFVQSHVVVVLAKVLLGDALLVLVKAALELGDGAAADHPDLVAHLRVAGKKKTSNERENENKRKNEATKKRRTTHHAPAARGTGCG